MKPTEAKKFDAVELTGEEMEKVSGGTVGNNIAKGSYKCEKNHRYNELTAKRYNYVCPLCKKELVACPVNG